MNKSEENRFYVVTALIASLLRLALMPFSLHVDPSFGGDLLVINWAALSFVHGPQYVASPYPPLALYTLGLFQSVSRSPLSRSLLAEPELLTETLSSSSIYYSLFSSKALYLLFDFMALFFLMRLFRENRRKRRLAWLFWLLNPLVIYNAYVHGQFDLIPVFFLVLSLFFVSRLKPRWAAVSLGIGICYKTFPLLFLLPLVIVATKDWRERLVLALLGAVPYLVLLIPFLEQYRRFGSGFQDWYFKAGYELGFGAEVYFFLVFYAILLWYLHSYKAHTIEVYWRACFAILLVFYQFSYFDLHYWAWVVPFAAIYWVERPREATPFYAAILACLMVLASPAPLARFLAPVSPGFFLRLPSALEALDPYLPMLFIVNVTRSLLTGTCFYLAWQLVRQMPTSCSGELGQN